MLHMSKDKQQVNPYPIRLTVELRAKLEDAAKTEGRSLNAEMLLRLESSFEDGDSELTVEKVKQIALDVVQSELAKRVQVTGSNHGEN